MLGHMKVDHLCDLVTLSWILTITFLLIVSNIVIIGKYLASTIHLLNDSHKLLSTLSQFDPNLNHALLQCCGWVLRIAWAPWTVALANLALAKLNNIRQGALAQAQNFFCHSFSVKCFFQLAYICLAQFLCSAFGAQFCTAFKIPYNKPT